MAKAGGPGHRVSYTLLCFILLLGPGGPLGGMGTSTVCRASTWVGTGRLNPHNLNTLHLRLLQSYASGPSSTTTSSPHKHHPFACFQGRSKPCLPPLGSITASHRDLQAGLPSTETNPRSNSQVWSEPSGDQFWQHSPCPRRDVSLSNPCSLCWVHDKDDTGKGFPISIS